jgi:hypothetical protein
LVGDARFFEQVIDYLGSLDLFRCLVDHNPYVLSESAGVIVADRLGITE